MINRQMKYLPPPTPGAILTLGSRDLNDTPNFRYSNTPYLSFLSNQNFLGLKLALGRAYV